VVSDDDMQGQIAQFAGKGVEDGLAVAKGTELVAVSIESTTVRFVVCDLSQRARGTRDTHSGLPELAVLT
jgi:hypothetical protein